MRDWTDQELQQIRYGVAKLAEDELIKKNLNQEQLRVIFHILAFGGVVNYRQYDPNIPEDERRSTMGYVGAGWFVEDHF